jgi:hypothetical protein
VALHHAHALHSSQKDAATLTPTTFKNEMTMPSWPQDSSRAPISMNHGISSSYVRASMEKIKHGRGTARLHGGERQVGGVCQRDLHCSGGARQESAEKLKEQTISGGS